MRPVKLQLIRYAARHSLLTESAHLSTPWLLIRNIFLQQQCMAIERELAERGWTLSRSLPERHGFPVYAALHRTGANIIVRYEQYQTESARLR